MHTHHHHGHHGGHCEAHRDRTPLGVAIGMNATTVMLLADTHKNFDVSTGASVSAATLDIHGVRDGRAGRIVVRSEVACQLSWTSASSVTTHAPDAASSLVAGGTVALFDYYGSGDACFVSRRR